MTLAAREQGTVAGVLACYPHLKVRDVAEALAFYQRHQAEVDDFIACNRDAT